MIFRRRKKNDEKNKKNRMKEKQTKKKYFIHKISISIFHLFHTIYDACNVFSSEIRNRSPIAFDEGCNFRLADVE